MVFSVIINTWNEIYWLFKEGEMYIKIRSRGFSLIELMTVIVIFAVILSLGVNSYMESKKVALLEKEASGLKSFISQVASSARSKGKDYQLTIPNGRNNNNLVFSSPYVLPGSELPALWRPTFVSNGDSSVRAYDFQVKYIRLADNNSTKIVDNNNRLNNNYSSTTESDCIFLPSGSMPPCMTASSAENNPDRVLPNADIRNKPFIIIDNGKQAMLLIVEAGGSVNMYYSKNYKNGDAINTDAEFKIKR